MTTTLFSCTLMHSYWIHFTFLSAPLRLFLVCNLRSLPRGWLLCRLRMPISISNPLRKKQQPLSWFSKSLPLPVWEKQPLSIYPSFSRSLQHFPSLRDTFFQNPCCTSFKLQTDILSWIQPCLSLPVAPSQIPPGGTAHAPEPSCSE